MSRTYRVQAFAALAGVTVKALHHYDRLGVLRPQRTDSGYRVYRDADLQRLAQVAALKLVGVPLKQIGPLLEGELRPLDDVLQSQQQMLRAKRHAIDRAIEAIDEARRRCAAGDADDPEILRILIEAVEMQNGVDVLKAYFDDEAWERWLAGHAGWPGEEWRQLLHDVEGALDQDPASEAGRALSARWMALVNSDIGDEPAARRAFTKAWHEWTVRPAARPKLLAGFPMERILRFIVDATSADRDRQLAASPELANAPPRTTPARRQLFHEARALLGSSPDSPAAHDLIRRLDAIFDRELGDDHAVRAGMRAAWRRRSHWPAGVTRWIATTYEMDPDTWTAVADFLDAARVSIGRD